MSAQVDVEPVGLAPAEAAGSDRSWLYVAIVALISGAALLLLAGIVVGFVSSM